MLRYLPRPASRAAAWPMSRVAASILTLPASGAATPLRWTASTPSKAGGAANAGVATASVPTDLDKLSVAELDALIESARARRSAAAAAPAAAAAGGRSAGDSPTLSPDAQPPSPLGGEGTAAYSSTTLPIPSPNGAQWAKLFVRTALPFFAFGVCDNIIMLSVGDLIDEHFGVIMGFSTLVAAGLGQAVSDGSGVTIQCVIERHATRLGLCESNVDPRYLATAGAQRILQIFRTIGIVVGCLVGLTPLLVMDAGNKPRMHDLLLKELDEADRRAVSSQARYVNHAKGTYLCNNGQPVEGIYTIVSGEVRIVRRDAAGCALTVCEQGPGSGIGFLEVVFGHDSVADVICETDVRTLRIDPEVIEARPALQERFRQQLDDYIHADPAYAPYLLQRPAARARPSTSTTTTTTDAESDAAAGTATP